MSTKNIIWTVLLLVVIAGLAIAFGIRGNESGNTSVSNEDQGTIGALVKGFGQKLRDVSVLAPKEELKKALSENYSEYVTSELLETWSNDPDQAIGRMTSNPWPESISVVSITKNGDTSYTVEGNVIEITTDNPKAVAGTYPVTFTLEKKGSTWLIASTTKGSYSTLPQRITIEGERICLPHKNTSGPQTLECAIGLAGNDGKNYALDTNLLSSTDTISTVHSATKLKVEGVLTPIEMISSNFGDKYDVAGIISVTSVTPLP